MSSLLLLTRMLVVIGSTCPPTICTEFFTECDIFFYYKARQELLQSATAFSLQCTTRVITKCDSFFLTKYDVCYYKVWQLFLLQVATLFHQKVAKRCYDKVQQVFQSATAFYQKVATILLQSVTGIAKCDRYYKVLRIIQSTTEQLTTFTTHYFNQSSSAKSTVRNKSIS